MDTDQRFDNHEWTRIDTNKFPFRGHWSIRGLSSGFIRIPSRFDKIPLRVHSCPFVVYLPALFVSLRG
jgi:hypothetical protein